METPKDYFKKRNIGLTIKECILCGMYANHFKNNTVNWIREEKQDGEE